MHGLEFSDPHPYPWTPVPVTPTGLPYPRYSLIGIKYKECVRAVRVMVWVGKGTLSKEGVRARNGRMRANVRPV